MAKARLVVNDKLIAAADSTPAKNPAPSSADKAYLRGLKRRGYTEQEIRVICQKAGLGELPVDFFVPKKKALLQSKQAPVSLDRK